MCVLIVSLILKIIFLKINQPWIPLWPSAANQRYYTCAGLSLRFSSTCARAEIVLYFELPENCGLLSISHNRWQGAQGRIQLDGTCSAFLGDKGTTVESSRRIIYQVSWNSVPRSKIRWNWCKNLTVRSFFKFLLELEETCAVTKKKDTFQGGIPDVTADNRHTRTKKLRFLCVDESFILLYIARYMKVQSR